MNTQASPAIELEGLSASVRGARLFGPLDLSVAEGEHVLVVGPSGSGKSSLLRVVAGLIAPDAGRASLFGRTVSEGRQLTVPAEERRVGFVFQGGALWPHMSAAKTLEFVLRGRNLSRSERKARIGSLLEQVELAGYEKRMPGTLSGGEAQRLSLARALAVEPRLLLLDEPLGPLDAELRASLIQRLAELQRELGLTVLHVTHDPDEAASVATRTVAIRDGRIDAGASS